MVHIAVTSHKRHGVSDFLPLICFTIHIFFFFVRGIHKNKTDQNKTKRIPLKPFLTCAEYRLNVPGPYLPPQSCSMTWLTRTAQYLMTRFIIAFRKVSKLWVWKMSFSYQICRMFRYQCQIHSGSTLWSTNLSRCEILYLLFPDNETPPGGWSSIFIEMLTWWNVKFALPEVL